MKPRLNPREYELSLQAPFSQLLICIFLLWRMAMTDGLYVADYKAIAIAIGHRVKVLNLRQNGGAS